MSARVKPALPSAEPPVDENGQQAFAALQALLAAVRGGVAPTLEASAEPQPIATRDLLRLLSHLQQYVPEPDVEDDFDLRNQLKQLLTRVSVKSGKSRVVEEADEDVINLIAMLFEFILNDHAVPDAFKALIARLQIPMLESGGAGQEPFQPRRPSGAAAAQRNRRVPPSVGARLKVTRVTACTCASSRWCSGC